ncbi:serpin peptidase inhibitor, clade F (alpha-2 antiplasmin, pigment epithelium derived factor), member 2b [Callorhinchus milii]|uniref:Alpha-2-antiplasmin n=1 Tax=Callorhinchus milii TaxID=7868 RepID=V9KPZ5_CALMI|nr:serpin peptidase inhibitor, clade F (alpha-2 antiplasmin, pigment epithelium derived factor), member 2b [Callorhinchus milii]|eukprot:gi/632957804/ref/XP_007894684.1/ PREDICTED: alpha-2-antiplasmin isoform X2 [Callorhinchus milii]
MDYRLIIALLLCFIRPSKSTEDIGTVSPTKTPDVSLCPSLDLPPEVSDPSKDEFSVTEQPVTLKSLPLDHTQSPHTESSTGSCMCTEEPGTSVSDKEPKPTQTPQEFQALASQPKPEVKPEDCSSSVTREQMESLGNAITDFGMDLFKKLLNETSKPNIVISPLSITLGLAQLALGSMNQTESQLRRTLHFNSFPCAHHSLRLMQKEFTNQALQIASRIYVKKGFHIKDEFVQTLEKYYKSQTQLLKGKSADDTKAINKWVEEVTKGKIKEFLREVPSNIILLLLNAIHFKGYWKAKFDPSVTAEGLFYAEDGKSFPVQMMQHPKYPLSVFMDDNLNVEVAKFSFKQNMSLIVIIPIMDSNISSVASELNIQELLPRFPRTKNIMVKLPKLDVDYDVDLNNVLKELGLGVIFSHPDFSRISDQPLFVSSVKHKATLELKEEGVEAAAATVVAMSRSFSMFSINRPFIFLIRDDHFGIPLFLGSIKNPQPRYHKKAQYQPYMSYDEDLRSEKLLGPK